MVGMTSAGDTDDGYPYHCPFCGHRYPVSGYRCIGGWADSPTQLPRVHAAVGAVPVGGPPGSGAVGVRYGCAGCDPDATSRGLADMCETHRTELRHWRDVERLGSGQTVIAAGPEPRTVHVQPTALDATYHPANNTHTIAMILDPQAPEADVTMEPGDRVEIHAPDGSAWQALVHTVRDTPSRHDVLIVVGDLARVHAAGAAPAAGVQG